MDPREEGKVSAVGNNGATLLHVHFTLLSNTVKHQLPNPSSVIWKVDYLIQAGSSIRLIVNMFLPLVCVHLPYSQHACVDESAFCLQQWH